MSAFLDKSVLFVLCFLCFAQSDSSKGLVIACLVSVSLSGLCQILKNKNARLVCIALFILCGIWIPQILLFFPLFTYDLVYTFSDGMDEGFEKLAEAYLFPFCVGGILLVAVLAGIFNQNRNAWLSVIGMQKLFIFLLLIFISGILSYRAKKEKILEQELILQRDSSTELNLVLKDKNKELLESQDSQIHIATLSERNRIAREIHDNVGHMLSRCILQIGALMVVHKEEPLHEQLTNVNETLNEAMTSIRKSVHDLHDESVDVKQSVEEIFKPMKENYVIDFQYDLSNHVEKEVKYCFINVIKEAATNIVKHSDATKVSVILREQPAFYQLSIEDNGHVSGGKNQKDVSAGGMGLQNMQERVEKLQGIFRYTCESGFRIFISIPKKMNS